VANPYYKSPHWRALRSDALKRAGFKCEVRGCGSRERLTVDHIKERPRDATGPTPMDVLGNLRVLCKAHDNQIMQGADGKRRSGGKLTVKGTDASGCPLDPAHPWNA